MDKHSAHEFLFEIESDTVCAILDEWRSYKGSDKRQSWKVIPSGLLINEWEYNCTTGMVHEKVIEKIQNIIIENYSKLWVNTILFSHTSINPFSYATDFWNNDYNTEEEFESFLEDFEWFAIDDDGNWRISDYGLDKIGGFVVGLLAEDDHSKKLYWIDRILNVVHQRSDLSSWFVEGGSKTLSVIAA